MEKNINVVKIDAVSEAQEADIRLGIEHNGDLAEEVVRFLDFVITNAGGEEETFLLKEGFLKTPGCEGDYNNCCSKEFDMTDLFEATHGKRNILQAIPTEQLEKELKRRYERQTI